MSTNNLARSIRDEILDLAGTLADTQTRLDFLVERLDTDSEEASNVWQIRCEELERSFKEAVNSAKWLRAQNEDLERRLNLHQPEISRALDAREAAFKRLKHARKVIRDLLEERRDMSSPRTGTLTQEEIEEALYGGDVFQPDDSSSSSSDTNRTVRVGLAPMDVLNTPKASSPSKTVPGSAFSQGRTTRLSPTHVKSPVLQSTPSSAGSSNLIRLSPNSKNSPETVSIHFKKPPGSASVRKGPFTLEKLQSYLGLNDDTMDSLRSLRISSEIKMRMHIMQLVDSEQNVAFLYDPIFVESGERSFAVYWSRPDTNKALEQEILQHQEKDSVFHTFTYPLKEQKAWFYIGAHRWSVVNSLGDLWPLEGKNRTIMIKKLCERTRGEVTEEEMGRMLDIGELQQISIELVGVLDTKESIDFAQNNLGRSPTHQLERRTAGSVQSA